MKKMIIDDKNFRTELNKLGIETQNKFWESRGIKPEKVRALESDTSERYAALYKKVLKEIESQGKEVLEQHKLSINREERWVNAARVVGIAQGNVGKTGIASWICHCHALHHASYEDRDKVLSGGNATNSWDPDPLNMTMAHPHVEVDGPGAGATSNAIAKVLFKFAFTPPITEYYCIKPTVMMSGFWLLWTWGDCAGSANGSGELKAVLRIRIDQLSSTIKEEEKVILNQNSTSSTSSMSGWNYNSVTDHGIPISALLEGGHEVVVFVECELSASIVNYGKAVVDMSTNSNYYFWVPFVRWGVRDCSHPTFFGSISELRQL